MKVRPDAKSREAQIKSFQVSDVITVLEKQLYRKTEKKERSRATMRKTLKLVREYKWELSYNS